MTAYGEGWFYANPTAMEVETVDIPIGMYGPIGGFIKNMEFDLGSAGATSAFADGENGAVLVTSNGHQLLTGDFITIMGSTNYNGVFQVLEVATNTFKILSTWVANDGIATWIEPTSLTANKAGVYHLDAHISASVDGLCTLIWKPYINTIPVVKGTVERKFPNNDVGNSAFAIFIELLVGDKVWMSVKSDSLVDITSKHGGMRVLRMGS